MGRSYNVTSPEEYILIRQEHIVKKIYGGKEDLPLETKEQLLMAKYGPNVEFGFHTTTLDENGKSVGDGHTRFAIRVELLERVLLADKGLIVEEYL